jgi:hypothetical protein
VALLFSGGFVSRIPLPSVQCILVLIVVACTPHRSAPVHSTGATATPTVFPTDSLGANIRDVALGTDIWLVNRGEPSVARYGRDGQVRWHGIAAGEGPDQARTIWSVVAIGDTAFAWDPWTLRVMRIFDGRVSTEVTLEFTAARSIAPFAHGITFGHPGRFRRWKDGWVAYATKDRQGQAKDLAGMVILHFARDGRILDTLADLRPVGVSALMGDHDPGPAELVPVPLWDVCGGSRFVLFQPDRQLLSWHDAGTGSRDSLTLGFTPGEIPESFMRAHLLWQFQTIAQGRIPEDTIRQQLDAIFPTEKHVFGTVTPYATSLFCDPDGIVWMQRFSIDFPPKGFSTEWVVIDPSTKRRMSASFPTGFQPMAADSALVYGVVEDEDGVQSLATLPRPAMQH